MSPLASDGVLVLVLCCAALMLGRWLKRRAALRTFAATHGFRFRGVLPSDKYEPYIHFSIVRRGVLLYHAMEGRWHDFDVAVFDFPERPGAYRTGVIVSVPNDSTRFQIIPPEIWQSVVLETNLGCLLVRPMRKVPADELQEFLEFVASLARALNADGHKL